MAHFARIRSPGFWTANSTLLHTEMEAIDANQSKAINGDEGGTWAPSSPIVVGGSGMEITGDLDVSGAAAFTGGITADEIAVTGDLTVQTNATVQGYLTAETDAEVQGALDVTGATTLSGGATVNGGDLAVAQDLAVQGNTDVTGNLTADGASVETLGIHSAVSPGKVFTADGAGNITGNFDVGGALAVTGAVSAASLTVSGNATLSGTTKAKGRFQKRLRVIASDANTTVNIADYDAVYLPSGVLTTDRAITVETSGAEPGDLIRVTSEDTANFFEVQASAVNTPLKKATGAVTWIELIYTGSAWVTSAFGKT